MLKCAASSDRRGVRLSSNYFRSPKTRVKRWMLVETWVKGLYPGLRVDAFERTISFSRGTWRNSDAHRHIECAHLCGRLELAASQDTKRMAEECGVTRTTIYNWSNHSDGLNPWPPVAKALYSGSGIDMTSEGR